MMIRLAIISSHPIQYNAPFFKLLAEEKYLQVKVFYTWSQRQNDFFDEKFGIDIKWDVPLLEGYEYEFVKNISKKPGNKHFRGIICPVLIPKIKSWSPTHVLVYGWNYHAHLKAMRHFKGEIPVLFRGDSHLLNENAKNFEDVWKKNNPKLITSFLKFKLRQTVLSLVYKHIDYALYVGKANRAYFKSMGLKDNQLVFVPHAIDNYRFMDDAKNDYSRKAELIRKNLGLSENEFIVVYAAKFEEIKNPLLLIRAIQSLNKQKKRNNKKIKLIIIGAGPLQQKIIETINGDENIKLMPFQNQSQMPVAYRLGQIFCLPSKSETWGLAVNEAIASGTIVVASNKCGCAFDLLQDLPHQIFVSDNIHSLENAILKSIHNHELGLTPDTQILNGYSYQTGVFHFMELLK